MARKTTSVKKTRQPKNAAPIKQPPAPIISFRVGPNHNAPNVSGYATTGIAGAFNAGFSTPGIAYGNLDPRASRYSIEATGSTLNIRTGRDNYNQTTPAKIAVPSQVPQSSFTAERVWSSALAGGASAQTASLSLPENQRLHARGSSQQDSFLQRQMFSGFYQNDTALQPAMQSLDHNLPYNTYNGHVATPVTPLHPVRLPFNTPGPVRQGDQNSGTVNNTQGMTVASPVGQFKLNFQNDVHTPQPVTSGYSAPGTHPAHGQTLTTPFDGSWTIDVLPGGQQQPTLQDLAPPADIPVQTYSGYGPTSSSIYASRPLGGRISQPRFQRGVRVQA